MPLYGVGWWAFTFPLGACTVSTLAGIWRVGLIESAGAGLFVLLAGFWLVVSRLHTGGPAYRPCMEAPGMEVLRILLTSCSLSAARRIYERRTFNTCTCSAIYR